MLLRHKALLAGYLFLLACAMVAHEPCGDELHSWNLATASTGVYDLLHNIRYEGHPPLWYLLLYFLCQFTHKPEAMQMLHFLISAGTIIFFCIRAPFAITTKALVLSGYYFLFEYSVVSRNYMLGVLFTFILCDLLTKKWRYRKPAIYAVAFLMSLTHILSMILAISLLLYHYADDFRERKRFAFREAIVAVIIFVPAIWFVIPPGDSALGLDFWRQSWKRDKLLIALQAPLRSTFPLPAFWKTNFWNTYALIETVKLGYFFKIVVLLLSALALIIQSRVLLPDRRLVRLIMLNFILTVILGMTIQIGTARYTGYLFVAFLACLWLRAYVGGSVPVKLNLLHIILALQVPGGVFIMAKDARLPFTNYREIPSLMKTLPADATVVADYGAIDYAISSFNRPIYCINSNEFHRFVQWDKKLEYNMRKKEAYSGGISGYFLGQKSSVVYLLSNAAAEKLEIADTSFNHRWKIDLLSSGVVPIDKHGHLRMYRVAAVNKGQ
jgi:hypothetical protein